MVGLWWPAQIVNLAGCLVMWVLKLEHGSGAAMHSRRGLRQHQFRSFNLQWDCETIKWCCVMVKQYYYNMVLKAGAFDFRQDRFLAWTAHKWLWLCCFVHSVVFQICANQAAIQVPWNSCCHFSKVLWLPSFTDVWNGR